MEIRLFTLENSSKTENMDKRGKQEIKTITKLSSNIFFFLKIVFFLDIVVHFNQLIKNDEDKSVGLAAIETLLKVLEISQCKFCFIIQICNQNFINIYINI